MKPNINFIQLRLPAFLFSGILIILSLWMILGPKTVDFGPLTPKGFNLGIDFQGGVMQQIIVYTGISQDEIRTYANQSGLGNEIVTVDIPENKRIGKETSYIIKTIITAEDEKVMKDKNLTSSKFLEEKVLKFIGLIKEKHGDEYTFTGGELAKVNTLYKIKEVKDGVVSYVDIGLKDEVISKISDSSRTVSNVVVEGQSVISASNSKDLAFQFIIMILVVLAIMLVYIWIRFNFNFGLGAWLSLFHDTIITLGFVSFLGLELDMTVGAAVLTLIGYSINDTIVIYDRIRENYGLMKDQPVKTIFNSSINQTLSRTIVTVTTVIVANAALLFFGGPKIYNFSLVFMFGLFFGTYSSIFVAAPIVDLWNSAFDKNVKVREDREKKKEAEIKVIKSDSSENNELSNTKEIDDNTISLSKSKLKKLSGGKK